MPPIPTGSRREAINRTKATVHSNVPSEAATEREQANEPTVMIGVLVVPKAGGAHQASICKQCKLMHGKPYTHVWQTIQREKK